MTMNRLVAMLLPFLLVCPCFGETLVRDLHLLGKLAATRPTRVCFASFQGEEYPNELLVRDGTLALYEIEWNPRNTISVNIEGADDYTFVMTHWIVDPYGSPSEVLLDIDTSQREYVTDFLTRFDWYRARMHAGDLVNPVTLRSPCWRENPEYNQSLETYGADWHHFSWWNASGSRLCLVVAYDCQEPVCQFLEIHGRERIEVNNDE